eukprot:5962588-Pyramimonas_sp.AAC.1
MQEQLQQVQKGMPQTAPLFSSMLDWTTAREYQSFADDLAVAIAVDKTPEVRDAALIVSEAEPGARKIILAKDPTICN